MTRWKCRKCSYIYDPRVGDPDGGIAPGTPFEKIPDGWRCPVCGVTKRDFYSLGTPPPAPAERRAPSPAVSAPVRLPPPHSAGPPPALAPARAHPGWTVGPLKRR